VRLTLPATRLTPRLQLHDRQHTAATRLLARGINIKVVSGMLGHSSIQHRHHAEYLWTCVASHAATGNSGYGCHTGAQW